MTFPPVPYDEPARLAALRALKVLDSTPEEEFDALVRAASLICDTPIALISLIDQDRQWFKANIGLPGVTETSREISFCGHAILHDGIFEVGDASKDLRFADSPLVVGESSIRFYAGAALRLSDGSAIGTLCVNDRVPKLLNSKQREILGYLAKATVTLLERRRAAIDYAESQASFKALGDSSPLGIFATDQFGACTYTNKRWRDIYGLMATEAANSAWLETALDPEQLGSARNWRDVLARGRDLDEEFRVNRPDGASRTVRVIATALKGEDGSSLGYVGSAEDVTDLALNRVRANGLMDAFRTQFIMSITDASGNIVEVNEAFCAISQYSREELIGTNHRIVNSGYHPDEFFAEMWQRIRAGDSWRMEVCNRAKDGSLYWVDSVIAPLLGSDGAIERFVSILSDITDRKLAEDALRTSQSFLQRTGRVAGVGGWEVDLVAGTLSWSDETSRLFGFEAGYVPTIEDGLKHYVPEARTIAETAWKAAIETGQPIDLELERISASGQSRWARVVGSVTFEDGRAVRIIGAYQDVTERVLARRDLEESKRRMTLAADSGRIGMWDLDPTTGALTWDAWTYRLYGLEPREELVDYNLWRDHVHPDDLARAEQVLHDALAGGPQFNIELRVIWDDGSTHVLRGTAHVTFDLDGKAVRMIGANWDVTEARQLSADLAEQHELLRVTLESIGDAVMTTDAAGHVLWMNPVAERLTGWQRAEANGRPLGEVFNTVNEDTRTPSENPVESCLIQGKVVKMTNHTLLISRHGAEYGIADSAAPIRDKNGDLRGVVLVFHDVTEQRRLSGEMRYRATHDPLTGLVNRSEFETRLRAVLRQSHEDDSCHALLYIDLDQFKLVNDSCGHSIGDQLLQRVSKLLADTVRARDTLARLGGDEFAIILEQCNLEQAQRVAQQICDSMDEFRFIHENSRFRIGASIGLVPIDRRWPTMVTVLQAADTSCYAAKEAGRNRVHVWFDSDQAMRLRHGEMQWTTRIEHALDENRFELYAQRLESLRGNSDELHAEVLLRMVDEDGDLIAPGAFLPAAERFHLASRIDRWVLKNTIEWMAALPSLRMIGLINVNLSGQSVGDRTFHRWCGEILAQAGSEICARLCVEITETAAVTNIADATLFITQVHSLGVRVALDDFGAGASSFGYLKSLPVDYLKIDRQFIRDLMTDPLDAATVRCFVDIAQVVGMETVAEGVEVQEVRDQLVSMGVDFAQGYLMHRPAPIAQLLENETPRAKVA